MPSGHILVADDDAAIRTVLNQALTRAGYEVRATGTVAGLWRWVAAGEGDLVITDVLMPDDNAFELLPRIKRMRPDLLVFAVQGDGDAVSIGLSELIYAANRGEAITIFLVNNAIYGMTGGQMAPTTPEGMVTMTSPHGRDITLTGPPLDASKLLATLNGPAYVKRVLLPVSPTPSPDRPVMPDQSLVAQLSNSCFKSTTLSLT